MITTSAVEAAQLTHEPEGDGGSEDELRRARAEVASLTLELRSVLRQADLAEQADTNGATADDGDGLDLTAARELLVASLSQQVEARRAELVALTEKGEEALDRISERQARWADGLAAGVDARAGKCPRRPADLARGSGGRRRPSPRRRGRR